MQTHAAQHDKAPRSAQLYLDKLCNSSSRIVISVTWIIPAEKSNFFDIRSVLEHGNKFLAGLNWSLVGH